MFEYNKKYDISNHLIKKIKTLPKSHCPNSNAQAWVLVDGRVGSNMQAIALAEAIDLEYHVVDVKYNALSLLPNILKPFGTYYVQSPNFGEILQHNVPRLLISASRRTAHISASIKRLFPQIKNIHILRPEMDFSYFDCVVLPQHDKGVSKKNNNVIRIIGSLNAIHKRIKDTYDIFMKKYTSYYNNPYIAVLVGGDTKDFHFDFEESKKFANILSNISHTNDVGLFLSFSRRTPQALKDTLKELSGKKCIIYDPASGEWNPYPSLIKDAKYVIATCDSISMVSEVATYGKPLYLYKPKLFTSNKHLTFLYQLQDLGIAKLITPSTDFLQEYNYNSLNEAHRISEYIISQLNSVK
ncbi:MAG: ELM1/GtrOC1 family putative glycosyltransferase [Rickettsiaceae bacterium]|nr:ELM1/GtrOC1 family putative glycosyltransferase [Rickettsiaceae bacterium]